MNDKQYMVSERQMLELSKKLHPNHLTYTDVKEFLKSKTPIEPFNRQEVYDIMYYLIYDPLRVSDEIDIEEFKEAIDKVCTLIPTPIEPSDDANLFPNARSMTKEEVQREKEYEAKHSKIIDISEPSDDARD